ncbi:MAG: pilus assembly protein N-terminal domain-containing protein, partial [Desulfobacterales bacterium]|nr:pilus assembly protein N-terminal domain-containing protein [Desulfobacterales bacterium]
MSTHSNKWYHAVITAIIALTIAAASPAAGAADSVITGPVTPQPLQMISGKSTILKSTLPVKRVSIADPEVADFILLSPNEIYVTAKKAGTTNLTLWQNGRLNAIYDLEVSYDLSRLTQLLHETLPNEKELRVMATHDSITLAGSVSSTVNLSQAMALARAFAPEEKVTNLVEVGGVHQVMLEIRMAEISKSTTKQFGINFNYSRGDRDFGVSLLGGLSQLVSPDDANIASSGGFGLNVSES